MLEVNNENSEILQLFPLDKSAAVPAAVNYIADESHVVQPMNINKNIFHGAAF